uniref:Uncharacterized protein n=1 Tax=viral metagenome TaxID=1070528 RepID=A0A6C0LLF9_9ZZZZ
MASKILFKTDKTQIKEAVGGILGGRFLPRKAFC